MYGREEEVLCVSLFMRIKSSHVVNSLENILHRTSASSYQKVETEFRSHQYYPSNFSISRREILLTYNTYDRQIYFLIDRYYHYVKRCKFSSRTFFLEMNIVSDIVLV